MKPIRAPGRADDAVTLDFDGEALVYHMRTGEVHHLDRIGSLVWQLLDGQTTVDELAPDLASAFDVDEGIVRPDVDRLLDRLAKAFLLAGGSPPPPSTEPQRLTNPPSP